MRILILLICFLPSITCAKNITLEWNYTYSTGSPIVGIYYDANDIEVTGFHVYKKLKGQSYDYELHVATIPANTHTVVVNCDGPYKFVVRSYNSEENSIDSNEVTNAVFSHIMIGR